MNSKCCCLATSLFQPLSHVSPPQYSEQRKTKAGLLNSIPCGWSGKAGHSLAMLFTFPMRKIKGGDVLSCHWDVLLWGKGDMGKVKLFFSPSTIRLFSDYYFYLFIYFLVQLCAETYPLNSWTPTKVLLLMGDYQNQCFVAVLSLYCWPYSYVFNSNNKASEQCNHIFKNWDRFFL